MMEKTISNSEKKDFIRLFVEKFYNDEISWFFEDLLNDEKKLNRIHFVNKLLPHQKGLNIYINDNHEFIFNFKKGRVKIKDIYMAYHELNMHETEAFCVAITFPDKTISYLHNNVLEMDEKYHQTLKLETHAYLERTAKIQHKKQIKCEIDKALENGNKEMFKKYVKRLKELE